ncbi:MAG: AGE family epimerase/isomerase, partial [Candidatus Brocadiae bacterium]|nr:AGE family epimerase/isomerase [Candidatus Brocadiia bacterium]
MGANVGEAETFRRHALQDILPHWHAHAIDGEFGGYIPQLDRRWRITDASRKNLVPTARLIYNFCQGHLLDGPGWCLDDARHGVDFLLQRFWDEIHGGWYWQVDRRGEPTEDAKGTYGHAFAILALSEFHRAFGDGPALEMAGRTFDVLEEHVYDPEHGGYRERHRRDWTRPDQVRTQNSQMHLVEALLALYEVSEDERYISRAAELCHLMNDKLFDHALGCLPEFFRDDWSELPDGRNYVMPGHQMEWAWLLLRVCAYRPDEVFFERARQMVGFALERGWDHKSGGYYAALSLTGQVSDAGKSYWPQCEAVMAPLWLWNHTGEGKHWAAFERAARYCFEHFVDREYGGWFSELTPDNKLRGHAKGGPWKADYHQVQ